MTRAVGWPLIWLALILPLVKEPVRTSLRAVSDELPQVFGPEMILPVVPTAATIGNDITPPIVGPITIE